LLSFFLQGLALGLTAAASPGPFQAYLISQSLAGGWRRGAPVAFAPLISDGPIIIAVLLLLDQLPSLLIRTISLVGGLFVLYLAWGLWQKWRVGAVDSDPNVSVDSQPGSARAVLLKGVLMNLLSPGPYTFWTLVNGPILLEASRVSIFSASAFLFSFYGMLIGGMLLIAMVFHQARRLGRRLVRGLTLTSILILVIFGGILISQSLRN
jgi:threonine/homoserine/homoserine lactone efflux protein